MHIYNFFIYKGGSGGDSPQKPTTHYKNQIKLRLFLYSEPGYFFLFFFQARADYFFLLFSETDYFFLIFSETDYFFLAKPETDFFFGK